MGATATRCATLRASYPWARSTQRDLPRPAGHAPCRAPATLTSTPAPLARTHYDYHYHYHHHYHHHYYHYYYNNYYCYYYY